MEPVVYDRPPKCPVVLALTKLNTAATLPQVLDG